MSVCANCGAALTGTEKFCGACGKKVELVSQQSAPHIASSPAHNARTAAPHPASNAGAQNQKKDAKRTLLVIGVVLAAAIAVGLFLDSENAQDSTAPNVTANSGTSTSQASAASSPAVSSSTSNASTQTSSNPNLRSPSNILPVERRALEIESNFAEAGIKDLAPYVKWFTSCEDCVPVIVFCDWPIVLFTELKGKTVRVNNAYLQRSVENVGGTPVRLAFADIKQALQTGIIDCALSGGAPLS